MASIVHPTPPDGSARRRLTRIVVTGSESTGKTTLANSIAEHYGVTWIPEFARDYAENKDEPLSADDVGPIAAGQIAREDAAFQTARGVIILDTDVVSTVVYAEHYYGRVPGWIEQAARERCADLYLLCDTDMPWVADQVRDAQHHRRQVHDLFVQRLAQLAATFRVVSGTTSPDQRLRRALEHIEDWRQSAQTSFA
jgi:NadR type nicotinamide-nucleotide adenylyltransferase